MGNLVVKREKNPKSLSSISENLNFDLEKQKLIEERYRYRRHRIDGKF